MLKESEPRRLRGHTKQDGTRLGLPAGLIDDMAGFGTLGAGLGGLIGSFADLPGLGMAIGGQLGLLFTIMKSLISGKRSA